MAGRGKDVVTIHAGEAVRALLPPGGAAHLAPEHPSLKREKDAQRESRASRALHTSRDYMVPGSTICNMSHKGHSYDLPRISSTPIC